MKNRFLDNLNNIIVLKIKTKNIDRFLSNLYKLNIDIYSVNVVSFKEVVVEINECDYNKVKKLSILNKIDIISYRGKKDKINKLKFNKILLISLFFGIVILIFLTNIIFSIEISHSSEKTRNFVMNELNKNGINVLQFRKSFKELEKIKNKILDNNKDKIVWLEIERIGTKYVVRLEERKINNITNNYEFQDIVAKRDAVIKKIVVNSGMKVKDINDYVKKGDIIISGNIYLNDEIKKTVEASGEVYGEVWYKLSVEYPLINDTKEETGNKKQVFSLNIFNKSIILFDKNGFNNSYVSKEYIYKNAILPIGISRDTIYELKSINGIYTEAEAILNAKEYSKNKMKELLDEDEYIISYKVLKYSSNSNTIYMDIFYKIYANITSVRRIDIERK